MSSKAIYQPKGKAREYAAWACNFYNGCSGMCDYCYCKKPPLSSTMGQSKPEIKKCFKDEKHALQIFEKELIQNLDDLKKYGLFFSFSTDPCLKETIQMTYMAMFICKEYDVPVVLLTKQTWWVDDFIKDINSLAPGMKLAVGFTITNKSEKEPGCATHTERVRALSALHDSWIDTWVSLEPIFSVTDGLLCIKDTISVTDHYKAGILSGSKWSPKDLRNLIFSASHLANENMGASFYWKDSIIQQAEISRDELPLECVERDYNMFAVDKAPDSDAPDGDGFEMSECPKCGETYDDADQDFLICHHCWWSESDKKYIK